MRNSLMTWNDYNPFKFFDDFEKEMGDVLNLNTTRERTFSPSCDMSESENEYFLSFDLPGVKKEDVNLELEKNVLKISGERKRESEKEGYSEKIYGRFSRTFTLPEEVDIEAVKAQYDNGVLNITLPKREQAKARKIEITS